MDPNVENTSQNNVVSIAEQPSRHSFIKVMLGLLVLAAAGVGALVATGTVSVSTLLEQDAEIAVATGTPEGLIFMSFVPKPFSSTAEGVISSMYDPADTDLWISRPDPSGTVEYQYTLSGSNAWITYIRVDDIDPTADISKFPFEVYRAYTRELTIFNAIQGARKLTNDRTTLKQFPVVSDIGDILYMAHSLTSGNSKTPEDWTIHFISREGGERVLAKGIHPKWIGVDAFIFERSDGLYLYSLDAQQERLVWRSSEPLSTDATLATSPDGLTVVLTIPARKEIHVFDTPQDDTSNLSLKGTVQGAGWHPIISSDGHFAAIVVGEEDEKPSSIAFIDLGAVEIVPTSNVNLTGWFEMARRRTLGDIAWTPPQDYVDESSLYELQLTSWFRVDYEHPPSNE